METCITTIRAYRPGLDYLIVQYFVRSLEENTKQRTDRGDVNVQSGFGEIDQLRDCTEGQVKWVRVITLQLHSVFRDPTLHVQKTFTSSAV